MADLKENEFGIKTIYDTTGKDSDELQNGIAKKEYVEFQKEMFHCNWDKMYDQYEKIYDAIGWPSPAMVATIIDAIGLPKDTPIFDVGVGSGLIGKELQQRGYNNIDGFDGCQGFVDMAKERGWYKDLFTSFVTTVEEFPFGDRVGKYDVVVSAGVLMKGNMPPCVFEIKDKLTKVGGFNVFSVSKVHWEEFGFQEAVKKLEDEGRWELVKREETLKYNNMQERVWEYTPTTEYGFLYRKLK